jgi:hypothetical protein
VVDDVGHRQRDDHAAQISGRPRVRNDLSLCDAISLVVVTTLLERMPCLAFDEDFRRLGLTVISTSG